MRKISQLAILALIPLGLFAARLTLRDGTTVNGRFVSGSDGRIVFMDDRGMRRTFNTNEIQTLDFNDTMAPARGAPNDAANRVDDRGRPAWATLPSGTPISVRTDETISADTAGEGRTYSGTIYQDVLDSTGNVVIPRGSRAGFVVRRVSEGGTVTSGNLALDLDTVEANGHRYRVSTEDLEKSGSQGIGANRRTARWSAAARYSERSWARSPAAVKARRSAPLPERPRAAVCKS